MLIQGIDAPLAKALGMDHPRGALVGEVEPDGPAAKAGLQPGDVIEDVDQTEVPHSEDLPRIVARHAPGSKVDLKILRGGHEQRRRHSRRIRDEKTKRTEKTDADDGPSSQARPRTSSASKSATRPAAARSVQRVAPDRLPTASSRRATSSWK